MTDLLLAVDMQHDASWQKALPEAVDEARRRSATLHVMAVVPDFGSSMVAQYFPAGFEKETLEKSAAALTEFCEANVPADVRWRAHLGHGDVVDEILRVAAETGVSLIVMGSHAPSEVRSFLIGSHADKIAHRSPVSVLIVR